MNGEDLSAFSLQRVTVREGAMIDASIWTAAHAFHETALHLHTRALHGVGIVMGLDVESTEPPSRSLILQPGVAVDADGRLIHVPQPLRLTLPQGTPGTTCVTLRFVETPASAPGADGVALLAANYQCVAAPPPPPPRDVEVARISFTDPSTVVRRAADATDPQPGELDTRFRRLLRPPTVAVLDVATLVTADSTWQLHQAGVANLVRTLQATAPFVVRHVGNLRPEALAGACRLLYLCGAGKASLGEQDLQHLQSFIRAGGALFVESCADEETRRQENGRFIATMQRLLTGIAGSVRPVEWGHPLLSVRNIFGAIPEGIGGSAPVLSGGNVILNPNDYGCCWAGRTAKGPLDRGVIRDALDFGVNVAWMAALPPAYAGADVAAAAAATS